MRLLTFLVPLLLLGAGAAAQEGVVAEADKELFVAKCASCHTVGAGDRVGPDLKDVATRRDHGWLVRMIQKPSAMLGSNPDARGLLTKYNGVKMPDLDLATEQVTALIALLETCSAAVCDLKGKFVPVTEAGEAEARLGRNLYLGVEPQQGGGPACISCHTVAAVGSLVAGGTLSKDLTNVFARLGDEGLDAALKNPAFIVMNKVFGDHPLTSDEAFALRAFLYQANRGELASLAAPRDPWNVPLAALLVALVALVVLNAAWSRRLHGVRGPLVAKRPSGAQP